MKYYSTNHQAPDASLQEAVVKGLASDKGLYMPHVIKALPQSFYDNIENLSFQEIAYQVADAFFGEDVPYFPLACEVASQADLLIVVGTSLNVYPAASLLQYAPSSAEIYVIDPNTPELGIYRHRAQHIQKNASIGVPQLVKKLIDTYLL